MMHLHRNAAGKLPRRAPRRSFPVETLKVDPRVWRKALELAHGDAKRIEIVSEIEVMVR